MPFVSIIRLRVRFWRYLPSIFIQTFRAVRQAKAAQDSILVAVLRDAARTFWTRTVWKDEAAMRSFMVSGVHKTVMPRLLEWCDEASVVHWNQDLREPPSWPEAHRRMQKDGRRSKVRNPSDAQRRFDIPAPQVGPTSELTFK